MTSGPLFETHTPGPSGVHSLPADVLQDAGRRVRYFAIFCIAIGVLALFLVYLVFPRISLDDNFSPAVLRVTKAFSLALFLLSAAILLVARSRRITPGHLLDLALVYAVLVAATMELFLYWGPPFPLYRGSVSWTSVWVIIMGVLIPNTPAKVLAAAYLCVLMDWLGFGVASARGLPGLYPPADLIPQTIVGFFIATFAVTPSLIVRRLGHQVREARELGNYRLESLIGKGGMGEVWLGRHRMLARPAAVKLIRPEMLGGSEKAELVRHRFEREAQATASLQSPHTVQLYDYGVAPDGTFYYVMELLDGVDLHTLVQKHGPLVPERVITVLRQVCWSLGEAHSRGLVHRDIKPANIFVCRSGLEVDVAKVLDFGLVKSRDEMENPSELATRDNVATGTPAFMAPEAATGKASLDGRSDLYSLGCVAYWLLTGTLPFTGETGMEILIKQVQEEPEWPSDRSDWELPRDLERLVMQCLEKDPAKRPQDALALAASLDHLVVDRPWTQERARKWWEEYLPAKAPEGVPAIDAATPQVLQTR